MTSNTLPEPVVNLIQATSGGLAAVSAISLFFPLDTARVYFQLDDDAANKSTMEMILKIVNDEGLWALYRGLGPISQSLMCSQFVYFYTYNFLKARLRSESPSVLRDLTAGFLAGCVNVLLTNPLWVANARMRVRGTKVLRRRRAVKGGAGETEQTTQALRADSAQSTANEAQYTTLVRTIRAIAKTEGIAACWRGTVPSLLLCVNPAVQFALYEALRRFVVRRIATRAGIAESVVALGTLQTFVISLIAKWVATVGTYPLQLVQTRLRTGLHSSDANRGSLAEYFASIVKQRGVAGLFRGLESKLLQTVLTSAFLMVVYEKLVAYLFRLLNVRKNH